MRLVGTGRRAAEMVLLHAYRKQSQQAPAWQVAIARRRMQEMLS